MGDVSGSFKTYFCDALGPEWAQIFIRSWELSYTSSPNAVPCPMQIEQEANEHEDEAKEELGDEESHSDKVDHDEYDEKTLEDSVKVRTF